MLTSELMRGKMFSKSSSYAIRSAIYVAKQGRRRKFIPIQEIARDLGIPFHFLTRILRSLTAAGLLRSSKGAHGGVALGKAPEEISLLEIVKAIEGDDVFRRCILGKGKCDDRSPCPLHDEWSPFRARLYRFFRETTLQSIGDGNLGLQAEDFGGGDRESFGAKQNGAKKWV